jgi:hypothetical protein
MIPERESGPPAPLTLEFVFVLAMCAPLLHLLWVVVFDKLGFHLAASAIGMAGLVTYVGFVWLCSLRMRAPLRLMGFVPAPPSAWLAVVFLAPVILLSSELDNWLKLAFPLPADPTAAAASGPTPPFLLPALALLYVGVEPLAYNIFYRGILLPLAVVRMRVIPGVILAAALSALGSAFVPAMFTNDPWLLLPALPLALVLCILRLSGASLWPVLALDALWGCARVGSILQLFGVEGFDAGGTHTPAKWLALAAALTAVGLGLCRAAARASSPGSSAPQS